jgi:hypothetical protein
LALYQNKISSPYLGRCHPQVKIVGLNCFHSAK